MMKIKFKEKYFCIEPGVEIDIVKNETNFWVGNNGSGKSVASAAIMALVGGNDQHASRWMAKPLKHDLDKVEASGFEDVVKISYSSSKMRQVQNVDLTAVFDMPGGMARLRCSEGENSLLDLVDAAKYKDNPNHLFIFDEVDSHLDAKNKAYFFDRILPNLKGTKIVCTHEIFFTIGEKKVFDFNDKTYKSAAKYIKELTRT